MPTNKPASPTTVTVAPDELLKEARAQRDWLIKECERIGVTVNVRIGAPIAEAYVLELPSAAVPVAQPTREPTNEFLWYVSGSSICEPAGTIAENLPKDVAELIVRTHNQEIEAFCRAAPTPVPVVAAPRLNEIRQRISAAERDEGHEHQEFESCEDCKVAVSARGWLQMNGWQNALAMLREIDDLEESLAGLKSAWQRSRKYSSVLQVALEQIASSDQKELNTSAFTLQQMAKAALANRLAAEAWVNRRTAASPEVKNDKQPETLSGCDRPRDNRLPTGRMDRTPTADHSIHEKGRLAGSNNSGTDVQDHAQIAESAPSPVSRPIRPEYQNVLTELAAQQGISEARLIEGAIAIYQLVQSGHSRLVEVNPEPKMAETSPVSREPLAGFLERTGKELARRTNLLDFAFSEMRRIAEEELRANTTGIDQLDSEEVRSDQHNSAGGANRSGASVDCKPSPVVSREPISAERWLTENFPSQCEHSDHLPMQLGNGAYYVVGKDGKRWRISELLEAYAHSLTTPRDEVTREEK